MTALLVLAGAAIAMGLLAVLITLDLTRRPNPNSDRSI